MSVYQLHRKQFLPISLDTAWQFFSSPHNLKEITPPDMAMTVLNDSAREKMFAGQVISYHVSPLLGIKLFWLTEITHVKDREYFVDEQRVGPYALWHHLHRFREVPGGVEMEDIVHYQLPLGPLGWIAYALFVRQKLEGIFDYRFKILERHFKG
ncbi:MAG: SRPBCC family protein [Bacteroidetes bacterium]|nr:SRPBCC family protein [Bacteroidota bacterium]